jgi:heterodisulfide reductase subunit C
MDENLYDVIEDFIDEKREEYEELLEEQADQD